MQSPLKSLLCLTALLLVCQCAPSTPIRRGNFQSGFNIHLPTAPVGQGVAAPTTTTHWQAVNLIRDYVPSGTHGRRVYRPMTPRYITVHSTQNFSAQADANQHALALQRGALRAPKRKGGNRIGYLIWHYTVDEAVVVQHMPTSEQGEHADFDGLGNRYSIGIEMCENRGNDRSATIERTALLCALLMREHNIPLRNIVPHYHWPRRGLSDPHKNCPHFLLDDGKPGRKWKWFLSRVNDYYQRTQPPSPPES
ncbi:MAG TPA: N-acetylmuramoyl-L-alanine amidase [Luteolibacter sp.]|nr:N-acetylmuramoyl-L-alanine amidase [Luteolibacter sp.]